MVVSMTAKFPQPWHRRRLIGLVAVPLVLCSAAPALAAGAFKAADHDWVVAVNAASLHNVAPGATFSYCASRHISAITPSITYSGAPVGQRYKEEVVGPKAAGTITLTSVHNVDGDVVPLKFVRSSGKWDNTYAIMSFVGSVGHDTLPPGHYSFVVVIAGKTAASTTLKLASRAGC
jgi:hypothetical protein